MTQIPAGSGLNRDLRPTQILGLISILVGCVSIFFSLSVGGLWWKFYTGSAPHIVQQPPLSAVGLAPYDGQTTRQYSMLASGRADILSAAAAIQTLSDGQRSMLDQALAELGRFCVPPTGNGSLHALRPRDDNRLAPGSGFVGLKIGSCVFIVGEKTVDCQPAGRSTEILTSNTVEGSDGTQGKYIWSVAGIDRTVGKLRTENPSLTDLQAAFIADTLKNRRGVTKLVLDGDLPVTIESVLAGNVIRVMLDGQAYFVLADGRSIEVEKSPDGVDAVTGQPKSSGDFEPIIQGDYRLMLALAIYECASGLLGAYLVIIGIASVILSADFRGVQSLYGWYSGLKFLLIGTEAGLSVFFFQSVSSSSTPALKPFDTDVGMQGLIETVVVQLIYPVVVLVVLAALRQQQNRKATLVVNPEP